MPLRPGRSLARHDFANHRARIVELPKSHHVAVVRIYLVAGLSLLLLTGSFYLFGFKPMSNRLQQEHAFKIKHYFESSMWLLQGVLDEYSELARQSASRTAIRLRQAAYLRGEIGLDELVAFSAPKLKDAMLANEDIIGITRFDPAGSKLFAVGIELPEAIVRQCALDELVQIRMLGPVRIGDAQRLIYCSPILDRNHGEVGADILVIKDDEIVRLMTLTDTHRDKAIVNGISADGRIVYWQGTQASTARGVLQTYIEHSVMQDGFIIRSRPLQDSEWRLHMVVEEERFFADINRQLLVLASAIAVVAVVLIVLTVATLRPFIYALIRQQQLVDLSRRDGLTGLYNHAYMQELLERKLSFAQRYQRPLSLLMFDIDNFKQINDNHGHQVGDEVVKSITRLVMQNLREQDVAARYGGDEFLLILPETGIEEASSVAERLRKLVEETGFTSAAGDVSVTISVGVTCCDGEATDKRQIIKTVDNALYRSKQQGRNRFSAIPAVSGLSAVPE